MLRYLKTLPSLLSALLLFSVCNLAAETEGTVSGFPEQLQAAFQPPSLEQGTPPFNADNTWIPRFVWIGDVQNSDNLKCFAAFLIGSLADKEGQKQLSASADPGVFITPIGAPSRFEEPSLEMQTAFLAKAHEQTPEHTHHVEKTKTKRQVPMDKPVWANTFFGLQAGVGFLYFDGLKGNLWLKPNSGVAAGFGSPNNFNVKGPLQYNRTPLMEMFFGFHLRKWLDFMVAFQTQQGIHISTAVNNYVTQTDHYTFTSHLESDLALNAISGGLKFNWPNFCRSKSWMCDLFIAGGAGGGWQSWTSVIEFTNELPSTAITACFRSQNYFNFIYNADAGITFLSRNPFSKTSLTFGCKFLGWGQTRRLGEIEDQNSPSLGLFKPLTIRGIYSCAPYIGFGWNF